MGETHGVQAPSPPPPMYETVGLFLFSVVVLGMILYGLSAFIIYAFLGKPSKKPLPEKPFCCPEMVEELDHILDFNADPCRSLFSFVCQRALDEPPHTGANIYREAYHNTLKGMRWDLYSGVTYGMNEASKAIVIFHRSCIHPILSESEADRQAVEFLKFFDDSWKVLRGNPTHETVVQLMVLLSLTYGIDTVLSMLLWSDVNMKICLNITLGYSVRAILRNDATLRYFVSRGLNWANRHIGSPKVATDEALAMDAALDLNQGTGESLQRTLSEVAADVLPDAGNETLALQISRALPSSVHLSDIDRIYAVPEHQLKRATQQVLRATRPRVAVAYLMARALVASMSPLLKYQMQHSTVHQAFLYCIVHSSSVPSLWNLAVVQKMGNPALTSSVLSMVTEIKEGAEKTLQAEGVLSPADVAAAVGKIRELHVYSPEDLVFPDIPIPRLKEDNVFYNTFLLTRYDYDVVGRTMSKRIPVGLEVDRNIQLQYVGASNSMFISVAALQAPLVIPNADEMLNWATVGVLLASDIYRSVGHSDEVVGTQAVGGHVSSASQAALAAQKQCLVGSYFNISEGDGTLSDSSYNEVLSVIRGLEFVWGFIEGNGNTSSAIKGPGWSMTDNQLFFVRFCLLWCGYKGDRQENEWRCDVPARNLPAFSEAFRCQPRSHDCRRPFVGPSTSVTRAKLRRVS